MIDDILKKEERAVFALRNLYRRYGYTPYKMNRFEEYDLYVRNKDFLVSDQIITFSDRSGRLLALKPDVTLSIVKNAPQEPGVVQKVYYNENVYRDYREIMQAGLECVGDLSGYEIAEVVLLAARSLELLGGQYVLEISHMGLVSAVISDLAPQLQKQAMDCLRQKNLHGLKALCQDIPEVWEKLERLSSCRGGSEVVEALAGVMTTQPERQALEELRVLWAVLENAGCAQYIRLDFSVGSDLRYYSGVVFAGYLEGIPSAVLSGGQYDRLLQRMGRRARAIGFAIYVDMLQSGDDAAYELDTLILHDGSADAAVLMAASAKAARGGSVLVARQMPGDRTWRRIIRFEEGVAK